MALLTPLETSAARKILSEYGLELKSITPLAAGSVNSNFLLEAEPNQLLFARIYEEQGAQGAEFELRLNQILSQQGLGVATPIARLDGSWVAQAGEKPFGLYHRVTGEVLCQKRVTERAARQVGAALAQVHTSNLGSLEVPKSRFGEAELAERLGRIEESVRLTPARSELLAGVEKVRSIMEFVRKEEKALPSGLIHGDLFRDNVLMHARPDGDFDLGALLDFESAAEGAFVYDLMVTLLAWCFGDELDAQLAASMVAGYHQVRPLSQLEREQMVVEGSRACARFATTRMTDFSLRTPPGETPLRDYRRFFQRQEALKQGALDQALAAVFKGDL